MIRRRSGLQAIGGAVVAALILAASPSAASAADTDAKYWSDAYGVEAAHAAGLTGAGVKIAVIDAQINPDLPVFEGRKLTVSDTQICETATSPVSATADVDSIHGTTMAAILIGNGTGGGQVEGMVPDAEVTFYGYGPRTDQECRGNGGLGLTAFGYAVKTAVDDGAKIITTSVTGSARQEDATAVAYALARGAVVITAEPNPDILADRTSDYGTINGVVATSAIDRQGDLQKNDKGDAFAVPQTTVVASGVNLPQVGTDGDWNSTVAASGSSLSAPTVAGMLAIAAQKFPTATGDQLVQAMLATTNASVHEPTRTEDGYGYGAAWLPTLLTVDPTQYPDESPLMGKSAGFPTQEQIDAAKADGFVAPPTAAPSFDLYDDPAQPAGFDPASLVPWIVGGIVILLLIGAAITIIIVVTQRRKAGKGSTS